MEQLSLSNINFPIFGITDKYKRIWEEHNVTYIETDTGVYVLDNKNMEGDTVGKRRLRIKTSQLYRPRKVFYNLSQMLRGKYTIFVDNFGTVFKYKKTKFVPLTYYKVTNTYRVEDGECVIEIPALNFSYKINCRKAYSITYVGLLDTQYGLIPYDFTDEYKPPTKRKI